MRQCLTVFLLTIAIYSIGFIAGMITMSRYQNTIQQTLDKHFPWPEDTPMPRLIGINCLGSGGDLWAMEESDFPTTCETIVEYN